MNEDVPDRDLQATAKPRVLADPGQPVSKDRPKVVGVRISARTNAILEKIAGDERVTKSALLSESIELFLASREQSLDVSAPTDADDRCAELRGSLLCMHLLETVLTAEPAFDAQTKHHFITVATEALYGSSR